MSQDLAPTPRPDKPPASDIMEQVISKGDLARLSTEERVTYYAEVCRSLGLNPLLKPFEYITLNGKLILYATKSCTDQLRKIHNINLEVISRSVTDGIMTAHVRATDDHGRADEDIGVVAVPETLRGEARANAEMKCVTKAKRRVTLSIAGLGFLDESEVDDITPRRPKPPGPNVIKYEPTPGAPATGAVPPASEATDAGGTELEPEPGPPPVSKAAERLQRHRNALDAASRRKDGTAQDCLAAIWRTIPNAADKAELKAELDDIFKPAALAADSNYGK